MKLEEALNEEIGCEFMDYCPFADLDRCLNLYNQDKEGCQHYWKYNLQRENERKKYNPNKIRITELMRNRE